MKKIICNQMKSYEIKWNHVIWDNILASDYLLEEKHISTVLILNENLVTNESGAQKLERD